VGSSSNITSPLNHHGFGDGEPFAPSAGERGSLGVRSANPAPAGELAQAAFAFGFVDMPRLRVPARATWRTVRPVGKAESCGT